MTCLDFRRLRGTDPAAMTAEQAAHRNACRPCAEFAAREAALERALSEAVRIPVPEGLASRILLHQSFGSVRRHPARRRAWALAASLLLGVALAAGGYFRAGPGSGGLDQDVVEMVRNAPYALTAKGPVDPRRIAEALRPTGLALAGDLREVTFAGNCIIRGRLAGHIVFAGRRAPVTVFLIPDQRVRARTPIRSPHWNGYVAPAPGGSVAVIGAPGETLEGIEARVRRAVLWPT